MLFWYTSDTQNGMTGGIIYLLTVPTIEVLLKMSHALFRLNSWNLGKANQFLTGHGWLKGHQQQMDWRWILNKNYASERSVFNCFLKDFVNMLSTCIDIFGLHLNTPVQWRWEEMFYSSKEDTIAALYSAPWGKKKV